MAAMSGIAKVDPDGKEIEGGVGQTVVKMKEKKAATGQRKGGRYDTLKDAAGATLKTDSGLTVIDTNRKVEKLVSHEMNIAKISVIGE